MNFIAAYGTHPSHPGCDRPWRAGALRRRRCSTWRPSPTRSTRQPRRTRSTSSTASATWANDADGVTTTGVDDIDLWVGGLAEKQMVFGGLLGPTFNYVFETQLEDLQDGDRFYYLSRTAGPQPAHPARGQLVRRAGHAQHRRRGTCRPTRSRGRTSPSTCRSSGPRARSWTTPTPSGTRRRCSPGMPNGTIRFAGGEHVVCNGTASGDRIWSSEGDDTMRGNDGDDWMQGGDGNDNLIGGLGDDIMQDLAGDDVLKGGDGDDALSSGQGFGGDLNQGGRGKDFIVGGNDITETFGGPGDDFVFAGDAEDTVFGDDGDDWIEGGKGPFNLLQGDNGAPFQDDPNEPGHDVLDGDGGEQDYDSEGGDDIMLAGPGIQRSEGMLGFDWVTHKNDPLAADSDMDFTGLLPPGVETNRDRFDLVEALSGWSKNDVLRGDDRRGRRPRWSSTSSTRPASTGSRAGGPAARRDDVVQRRQHHHRRRRQRPDRGPWRRRHHRR